MEPDRHRLVQDLFHAALERDVASRQAFLNDACAGDTEILREVESLLAHAQSTGAFFDAVVSRAEPSSDDHPALVIGKRWGTYDVVGSLGAGGMGEVYLARDTRLNRAVALKLLPGRFSFDGARRARFEREATLLASLNHPNVATLHNIEQLDGVLALVMEHVEGSTLGDLIRQSGAQGLGLNRTVTFGLQIAEALGAAHERGIVHRDLKPANIKITPAGRVKVLDFGVAKVFDTDHGDTMADVTVAGAGGATAVIGTPAYMSPEQAQGLPVDARTDIWAFGCVLHEMLTGMRPFNGRNQAELLAAIVSRDPPRVSSVQPLIPPSLDQLVSRCLSKNREDRLQSARDVHAHLEAINDALLPRSGAAPTARARGTRSWRRIVAYAAGGTVVGATVIWLAIRPSPAPLGPPEWTALALPDNAPLVGTGPSGGIDVSEDGSRMIYSSAEGVAVRSRDRLEVTSIKLGPTVMDRFLSPDGEWIGYIADGSLKKVAIDGGAPVTLASGFGAGATGTWGSDDTILVADERGLFRVDAEKATSPERLKADALPPGEQMLYPQLLPGDRHVLATIGRTKTFPATAAQAPDARVDVIDLGTGRRRTVVKGSGHARFVPSGHLVYLKRSAIHAVTFDLRSLDVRGDPVELLAGSSAFSVSSEGTLFYVLDGGAENRTLVWVDRRGEEQSLGAPPAPYLYPRLSPDGTLVALDVNTPDRDIRIWDLQRRTLRRFSLDDAPNQLSAWTRDGRRLVFGSVRSKVTNLFIQDLFGSGAHRQLIESSHLQQPLSFAPDGRLLFTEATPGAGRDIRALSMDGSNRVETLLGSVGVEGTAEVSPDGRWIAYDSDEAGQFEVYVRPYPPTEAGSRWTISSAGGRQPLWSRTGHELYYRDFKGALMVVPVTRTRSSSFSHGPVTTVLDGDGYVGGGSNLSGRHYDVADDGRFLMVKNTVDGQTPRLVQVRNWLALLNPLGSSHR